MKSTKSVQRRKKTHTKSPKDKESGIEVPWLVGFTKIQDLGNVCSFYELSKVLKDDHEEPIQLPDRHPGNFHKTSAVKIPGSVLGQSYRPTLLPRRTPGLRKMRFLPVLHGKIETCASQGILQMTCKGFLDGFGIVGFIGILGPKVLVRDMTTFRKVQQAIWKQSQLYIRYK